MKNLVGNKAITLVALVVTIIILLILAGITISQLIGSGLFENSKLAKEKYENSKQKEDEEIYEITNLFNEYTINSVRNDDWLNKNTWEKLFDIGFSLEEIINNKVVFDKVLDKEADIQYMLNDTQEILPQVVNSKVAMTEIGKKDNIYKRIFGDTTENIPVNTTWLSAILNSSNAISGLDESNPITVPEMSDYRRGDKTVIKASSEYTDDSGYAWKAFNSATTATTSSWMGNSLPAWIQYEFEEPVLVYKFYIQNRNVGSKWTNAPIEFSLDGSNDESQWDTIESYTRTKIASMQDDAFVVKNINKRYKFYRISVTKTKCTDNSDSPMASIQRLQFYGK